MGIPVSLLGTIFVLHMFGQTLNMMSMFALIMALGLIVDDAIVIGENVYSGVERGELPRLAAVNGTRRVLMPVIAAVMTTWLAFVPMLFIPGVMGKFIQVFPIVVILALAFSLVECVLILPPHLAHSLRAQRRHQEHASAPTHTAEVIRARIDGIIRGFVDGPFMRTYRLVTRYRYITIALLLGVLVLTVGAQQAGFIPFITMPKDVDSDMIRARVTLQTGTSFERTRDVARQVTDAVKRINEQDKGEDGEPIVRHVYSLLGQHGRQSGGSSKGSHLCQVIVELSPTECRGRSFTSEQIIQMWRKNTGPIPDAVSHKFGSFRGGPGGAAFEIRLMGPSTDFLKEPAKHLGDRLGEFTGVSDISDDAIPGNMEMKIVRLKPGAENLGITLEMLSAQLRDAFYGNESVKIQRGRDEIKVMVRYPASQRRSLGDVENMRVRTAAGDEVPFGVVADVVMERGYTTLRRVGRNSVVTVSADIDEKTANAKTILDKLSSEKGFFAELKEEYPGLKIEKIGQSQQMVETFDALKIWFPIALMAIYTILAAMFRSYIQPIIIMIAIPFGLVGAVIGHWVLGFDVTMLSVFGMVALAGIVVNDSLVLIDQINRGVRAGGSVLASVAEGARSRFRPIVLTTITTVAGITPLLFERSYQAQFLKPMAVSLAFGLLFATVLTLLVVPSLYLIGNDLRRVFRWQRTGVWPSPEDVIKRDEPMEE
jgi:multidrug efflux pump subunit AcrB